MTSHFILYVMIMLKRTALLLFVFACVINLSAQVALTHVVKEGETLSGIAQKYGVSEALLKQVNPNMGNYFYVGLVLNIPAKIDNSINEGVESNNNDRQESNAYLPTTIEAQSHEVTTKLVKEVVNRGAMYWGFDGYCNYGYFCEALEYNSIGMESALRTKFEKHSNFNWDIGFNYSLGLYHDTKNAMMITIACSPMSLRTQDTYSMSEGKYKNDIFIDAYWSIRYTVKLGCFAFTCGYFDWLPKWENSTSGFCLGIMYSK